MDEIARFLSMHPPWRSLSVAEVAGVAARLEIEYFPRGARLMSAGSRPPSRLIVIRSGSVDLLRSGRTGVELVDRLGEGDAVGADAVARQQAPEVDAVAAEDTLAYLLPREHLVPLLEFPPIRTFLSGTPGERVRAFVETGVTVPDGGFLRLPVGTLVTRSPLACDPATPVDQAARRMRDAGVGSILVLSEPPGIVTDRDLRDRVLATGSDPQGPVGAIASRPLVHVREDVRVLDALVLLMERGLRHLPVARDGTIVGVVTDTDLLRRQSRSPLLLHRVLERARDAGETASWMGLAGGAVEELVAEGLGAAGVGVVASVASDMLWRRLVDDAIARRGPAPGAWTWLATGAEGRREAFWPPSRAGFVLWEDGASQEQIAWCAGLAGEVATRLPAAGLRPAMAAPCPVEAGGLGPASAALAASMVGGEPRLLRALLDARPVTGPLDPGPFLKGLRDAAREEGSFEPGVLKGLEPPPKGFFRDGFLEPDGRIGDRLDLDARCLRTLIVLARVAAVRGGVPVTSTPGRLAGAADAGVLPRGLALDLASAWELLAGLCLQRGATPGRAGDCILSVGTLAPSERRLLKDAFSVIREGYAAIAGAAPAGGDPWTA